MRARQLAKGTREMPTGTYRSHDTVNATMRERELQSYLACNRVIRVPSGSAGGGAPPKGTTQGPHGLKARHASLWDVQ